MAIEKSWGAVAPQLFTSDGNAFGVVNIANTAGFKVKQTVTIANGSPSTLQVQVQVKRVVSSTQLIVGPIALSLQPPFKQQGNSLLSVRENISAYTVALGAYIYAAEQPKLPIDPKDIIQAVYRQEPGTTIGVEIDDQFGNPIGNIVDSHGVNRLAVDASLSVESIEIGTVDQGSPNTPANAWPVVATNFPTTVDTNYGTVGNNTIRTAAQIGNATGSANFGAGLTTAQTLRVTSNLSDGLGNPISSTGGSLNVNLTSESIQIDVGVVDESSFLYGTSIEQPIGGVYQDTSPTLTSGTTGAVRVTQYRAFHTNLRNSAGTELDYNYGAADSSTLRVASQIGNSTGAADFNSGVATAQTLRVVLPTDQSAIPVTQSTSPWVTSESNFPTTVDTNYGTVGSSTIRTASQIGNATGSADFNAGNADAQTLRVVIATNQSALPVTQSGIWTVSATQGTSPWVVSGTVAATQSGTWTTRIEDSSGNALNSTTGSLNVDVTNIVPVSQSGTWTTGRTWTLSNSTDSVTAFQGTNPWIISGTVISSNFPTTVDTNYGVVGANTIRTAAQIGNATGSADFNAGATTAQTLRVSANQGTSPWVVSGTVAISGTVAVTQSTTPWVVSQSSTPWLVQDSSDGAVSNGSAATKSSLGGLIYLSSAPTLTTGNQNSLLGDINGNLLVNLQTSIPAGSNTIGSIASIINALPAGSNNIGSVNQGTSPWVISGTVTANQGGAWTVAATQSGVWTTGRTWTLASGTDSVSVVQSTSPWVTSDLADGSVTPGTAGTKSLLGGLIYESAGITLTNGQQAALQGDASGNLRVNLETAIPAGANTIGSIASIVNPLPAGTNVIGAVNQGTSPWVVSGTVTANQGTSPWVTSASQSGTWTVQQGTPPWSFTGTLTNNNAAPGANNVGALVALAESTINPSRYTSGDQVLLVTDLAGNANVDLQYYLGSAVSKTNPIATTIADGTNVISNAISAYGTAPTGTAVMGVNSYITNVPAVSQSGTWTVQQGNAPWSVSQSGAWTTGRTWTLASGTDSVSVVQSTSPWVTKDQSDGPVTPGTVASFSSLIGGQYNSTLPTLTNGQQSAIQLDSSGRLIPSETQDAYTTGSLAALNATLALSVNSISSAVLEIEGTWIGTIIIEGSNDSGTIWNSRSLIVSGSITSAGVTANGYYRILGVGAYKQLRARMSAYTSGSATVYLNASTGTDVVGAVNTNAANFLTEAYTFDGTGNAITSTSINSKQRLDVDLASEGPSGSAAPFDTVQVGGRNPSGNLKSLATDRLNNLRTVNASDVSVFGPLVTLSRVQQLGIDFSESIANNNLTQTTTGTGTISLSNSNATISTGTGTTSSAQLQTVGTIVYTPGREIYVQFTAAFTTPTSAASTQYTGLYNGTDGIFLGYTGLNFSIASSAGGSIVSVSQASFNLDTLTGGTNSLFTRNGTPEAVNFTFKNIYRIRAGWLGAAPIYFEILSPDGQWVTFHIINQPNTSVNPAFLQPSLPVTMVVTKTASDSTNLQIITTSWDAGIVDLATSADNGNAGTISALNGSVMMNTSERQTIVADVTGTWSASLQIQGDVGDGTWNAINGVTSSGVEVQSITANNTLIIQCAGYNAIRIFATSYTSGTANIEWVGTQGLQSVINIPVVQATYTASMNNIIPPASATDIVSIKGSATKKVIVKQINITGTQTTASAENISLIKRSTLDTGGGTGTIVQQQSSYTTASSTTATVTVTSTGAGNLLVVGVSNFDNRNVSSVSDGTSSFTASGAAAGGANIVTDVWYLSSSNAGKTTITVTFNGTSTTKAIWFWELQGGGKTLDQFAHLNNGTVAATNTGASVTNTEPDFAVGIIATQGTITASPASGGSFTNGSILNSGTTAAAWTFAGAGAIAPSWSDSGSGVFQSSTASFVVTGNTQPVIAAVSHDSSDSAAAGSVNYYFSNPTLGTSVGTIRSTKTFIPTTAGAPGAVSWSLVPNLGKGIILNNANESLNINLGGQTISGGSLAVDIDWTEK